MGSKRRCFLTEKKIRSTLRITVGKKNLNPWKGHFWHEKRKEMLKRYFSGHSRVPCRSPLTWKAERGRCRERFGRRKREKL